MKKIGLLALVFTFIVVFSLGCSSAKTETEKGSSNNPEQSPSSTVENSNENANNADKKLRIAYVAGITTDAFYISMKFGAEEVAKKLGVDLVWTGAPEWDYTKQTPIVESLIAEKVDAIILAPNDSKAMIAPLKKAVDAGIPVFTVDTNVDDDSVYVANVTSDNAQGGKLGAETLANLIGEKGKVVVMGPKPGISTTDARQNGFLETIKSYPDIEVVATEYCDDQATVAAKKIQDILLAHPDLAGVFTTNVVSGEGVAQGLRVKNKAGTTKLVSYDAGPEQVKSLKAGELQAIISQKPLEEARKIMEIAVDYLQGNQSQEKHTVLDNVSVTPENVDNEEVKMWLYRTE